jgi:hypothetical protein
VQYIPATRCVTTYPLSVEQAGAAPWPTIGVVEVTPSGLHHRLFDDDPHLPGLALAADAVAMQKQFSAVGEAQGQVNRVQACTVTPIRYKPGVRCTFRYDLATAQGRKTCFGKLLTQNGAQLWHTVATLDQASQQEPELPRISQPLAYWPEMQMLVQSAVAGDELHTAAFDSQINVAMRLDWLRAAGKCIAAFHTCTGIAAPRRTLAADLAELDDYGPALQQVNPELADRFAEAITTIQTATYRQSELAPAVSHGALRTDQFLIEAGHLVLIDLDSVCWANPARDLGNLLAYLTWKALRQPHHATFIQLAQQAFLEGYARLRALPATEWVAYYQAASMLKIVGRRYAGLTYKEWPLTEELLDRAMRMIGVHRPSSIVHRPSSLVIRLIPMTNDDGRYTLQGASHADAKASRCASPNPT